jgi:gliding motility-associated-like protein
LWQNNSFSAQSTGFSYTFSQLVPGTYQVKFTYVPSPAVAGCTPPVGGFESSVRTITVNPVPPVPSTPTVVSGYDGSTPVCANNTNAITYSTNLISGAQYLWDFGDGTSELTAVPEATKIFDRPGSGVENLIVRVRAVQNGCTSSFSGGFTQPVVRRPEVNVAEIEDFKKCISTGSTVFATLVNNGSSGSITQFIVDWGDGTIESFTPAQFATQPNHVYLSIQDYVIKVTGIAGTGCDFTANYPLVSGKSPVALADIKPILFSSQVNFGCTQHCIRFVNTSTNITPSVVFELDFGDGAPGSVVNLDALSVGDSVDYCYIKPTCTNGDNSNFYAIRLRARLTNGSCPSPLDSSIFIRSPIRVFERAKANFEVDFPTDCGTLPVPVTFFNITRPNYCATTQNHKYEWWAWRTNNPADTVWKKDFPIVPAVPQGPDGSPPAIQQQFTKLMQPGSYTVKLRVTNLSTSNGCGFDTIVKTVVVPDLTIPVVSVNPSSVTVFADQPGTLTASSSFPVSYSWTPTGQTTAVLTDNPPATTTYTVTGTTAAGCTSTATGTIIKCATVSTGLTIVSTPAVPSICQGESITLSCPSPGDVFTWQPGNQTGPSITVSPTATTVYTVSSGTGACFVSQTIAVTVRPRPQPVCSASSTTIFLDQSTTLNCTATGGSGFTYLWQPGNLAGQNPVVNPGTTTTYTCTVTNSQGCSNTCTVTITVCNALSTGVGVAPVNPICAGQSTTLSVTTPGSGFTWEPGGLSGNSVTVNPTQTTTYTVSTGSGACLSTGTVTVVVNPNPVVSCTATPSGIIQGQSSTLSCSADIPGCTFSWSTGAAGSSTVVSPGVNTTYTVTATAPGTGCTGTATVTVVVCTAPIANFSITPSNPTICQGAQVILEADPTVVGSEPVSWEPGGLSGPVVNVSPNQTTTYTCTIGVGNCSSTSTVTVTVIPAPVVTVTPANTTIYQGSTAVLTASCNQPSCTFSWSDGSTGPVISVSPTQTTTYTCTCTGTGGCTSTAEVTVVVCPNKGPVLNVTPSSAQICEGQSVTLTADTGGPACTWQPGGFVGNVFTATPTVTTTYTCTVGTGACAATGTVTVEVFPFPTVTATASADTVYQGGSVTVTATANQPGATFTWFPGELTGPTITDNPTTTTTYTCVCSNGPGCTSTTTVTVFVCANKGPVIGITPSSPQICEGQSVTLTADTGGPACTWQPGGFVGNVFTATPAVTTTYTCTVGTGACAATGTVTVEVFPFPTVTATASADTVYQGGTVTVTATANQPGTTFTWFPGGTSGPTITDNPTTTTTYTCVCSNGPGCTSTTTVTVFVCANKGPVIGITPSSPQICEGQSVTLTADTGGPACTWQPGGSVGNVFTASPSVTTTYTCTVGTGACAATGTITVEVFPFPTVTATASADTVYQGGSVTVTATANQPGATFTWFPGGLTGPTITDNPTTTTTYTCVCSNGPGCTSTTTVTVFVCANKGPVIGITPSSPQICEGQSVTLTADTGGPACTWQPGGSVGNVFTASPSVTTTYTCTVGTGACAATGTVTVVVNPAPTVTLNPSNSTIFPGQSVTLTAVPSPTGSTVFWPQLNSGNTVVNVSPTQTTTYTVVCTGLNGCTTSNTATVTVCPNNGPTIAITPSNATICAGQSVTLTANTGGPACTWQPGGFVGNVFTATPAVTTTYTCTVGTGACTATGTVTVVVNPVPPVTATATPAVLFTATDATTLSATASIPGCTFGWSPGNQVGASVSVVPGQTTTYTVTCTAPTGCSATATVVVEVCPVVSTGISITPGNPSICQGQSISLTATTPSASPYNWNPGNLIGNTVTVSPGQTTTYTVTTGSGACFASTTITVIVNPNPVVTATALPDQLFTNDFTSLNASASVPGCTFSWAPNGVIGQTIVDVPGQSTVYTVTATSPAGCTGTATVSVSVCPGVSTGIQTGPAQTICRGDTATISCTLTGGQTNAIWQPGGLTGTTVTVSPAQTTIYTVFSGTGSCQSTGTVIVIVNDKPSVSVSANPQVPLPGQTVTLTATASPDVVSYNWQPGNFSGPSVTVTPTVTTVYTCTVTNASGCTATATETVYYCIDPNNPFTITATKTEICEGETVVLTTPSIGTITWSVPQQTGPSITVSPTQTTTYFAQSVLADCIQKDEITITVIPLPVRGSLCLCSDQVFCSPARPLPFEPGTPAQGPEITYQWQDSIPGAGWTNIPGAVDAGYAHPDVLFTTRYFRRQSIVAGRCTLVCNNVVTVRIEEPLTNVSVQARAASCSAAADGQITITPTGLQYSLNGGPLQTSNIYNGLFPGTYQVRVVRDNGCDTTLVQAISFTPDVDVKIEAIQPTRCGEVSGVRFFSPSGASLDGLRFSLDNQNFQTSPTFNVGAGVYPGWVRVSDVCTLFVGFATIQPLPSLFVVGQTNSQRFICIGDNVLDNELGRITVLPVTGTEPFRIEWSDAPANTSFIREGLNPGLYTATVTDALGCDTTLLFDLNSLTVLAPRASFSLRGEPANGLNIVGEDTVGGAYTVTMCSRTGVRFVNTSTPGRDSLIYLWDFNEYVAGSTSTEFEPVYTFSRTGRHFVTLRTVNQYTGCYDGDTVIVDVTPESTCRCVAFPNVFSPNGDGLNDTWPASVQEMPFKYPDLKAIIFDRWGLVTFRIPEDGPVWPGNFRNKPGSDAQEEVFVFRVRCDDGTLGPASTVTIIR